MDGSDLRERHLGEGVARWVDDLYRFMHDITLLGMRFPLEDIVHAYTSVVRSQSFGTRRRYLQKLYFETPLLLKNTGMGYNTAKLAQVA